MSVDFLEAKKELEKIFEIAHSSRKIVFWYDEGKNFFESVKSYKFDNVETIISMRIIHLKLSIISK